MIIPVILAGGSGTRLWPLSRTLYPKQLIDIYNENTMLQNTVLRLEGIEMLDSPIIVCNEEHRFMTAEQLREIKIDPNAIILEPVGRNTAPAIALAALKAMENKKDPVLLVLPADHVIEKIADFHTAIQAGLGYAKKDKIDFAANINPQGYISFRAINGSGCKVNEISKEYLSGNGHTAAAGGRLPNAGETKFKEEELIPLFKAIINKA